jgi:hypothetical protein
MKGKMLTATAYPPPPPPQSSPKKDSRKLIVVALLIVIIVVSAGVLFYLATRPSSTGNPTPTPTGMATPTPTGTGATPTPTGTSPTATPSGTNPMANWRAGSWALYTIKTYDAGAVAAESTLKYSMDEGTLNVGNYSGTACWILGYEMQSTQEGSTTKTVMTFWVSKSTLEGVHSKVQMYTNNEVIYEHEGDIAPGETGDMPEPIDMTTVTSQETITVPAGTFNCGKVTITTTVSGTTQTTSSWANSDIPIIGLVKIEQTSGGALISTTELTSYHS